MGIKKLKKTEETKMELTTRQVERNVWSRAIENVAVKISNKEDEASYHLGISVTSMGEKSEISNRKYRYCEDELEYLRGIRLSFEQLYLKTEIEDLQEFCFKNNVILHLEDKSSCVTATIDSKNFVCMPYQNSLSTNIREVKDWVLQSLKETVTS